MPFVWDTGTRYVWENAPDGLALSNEALRHCSDAVAFARERLGFEPDPKQEEVLRELPRRLLLCCSRQWGKSTLTALAAVHHAYFRSRAEIVVAAPCERQAAELVSKARRFARSLGIAVKGDRMNKVACVFPNGSRMVAIPSREDKIRGFSAVSMLVLDEASRVADELYEAVRPMLATTDGSLWLTSTPYGKRGFFYKEWAFGGPEWTRVSVRAPECSRISERFLQGERERLGQATFAQEYLCEFVQGQDALFREEDVRACLRADVPPLDVAGWS